MFAKVFKGLFYGSLTGQSDPQLVLVCLLTHCDRDGHVELPSSVIAALTGLPQERVQAALGTLEAHDPASRTEASEGRRLERTGPGRWLVVSYEKYRTMRDEDARREQTREAVRRHRAKRESNSKPDVSHGKPPKAHVEVEVEVDQHTCPPDGGCARGGGKRREAEPPGFPEFYQAYPRHDGRRAAAQEFQRALRRNPTYTAADLRAAAVEFQKQVESEGREARFIPLPRTWLSQDRFREFFDEDDHAQAQVADV